MAKRNPGGGIGSRVNREVAVRYGQRAERISEKGTSQIGQSMGNHITERKGTVSGAVEKVRGELRPQGTPGSVPLGNQIAGNVGKGGPGTGRDVQRCGSQGVHGEVNRGLGRIADTRHQWPDTSK
jgi:hypothetical protein